MDKKGTNNELNNDVKSKGSWKYSIKGKIIRRVFCLMTYMIFVTFVGLAGFVFYEFGTEIITNKNYNFYESDRFRNRVSDEALLVAEAIHDIRNNDQTSTFKIIDADKNMINTYNLRDLMSAEIYTVDSLSSIKQFLVDSTPLDGSIYDEQYGLKLIEDKGIDSYDDCYLFFTRESFKKLFIQNGVQNTNNWLSDKFSESAYFIYLEPDIMSVIREKAKYQDFNITFVDSTNDIYNMSDQKFAVYDPSQDIYYSSWDDYFISFTHYIYKLSDMFVEICNHHEVNENVSNIVFPALWSENYRDIWEFVSSKYDGIDNPEYEIDLRSQSAFVYYMLLDNEDSTVYSNVGGLRDILKEDNINSYVLVHEYYDGMTSKVANAYQELYGYEDIVDTLNEIGNNCVMYFGIDPSRLTAEDQSLAASYVWAYRKIGCHIWFIMIGALVSFILLIVQAVSLIKTTGRMSIEDNNIILNWFDKFYFEIWLLIYIGVIVLSLLVSHYAVTSVMHFHNVTKFGYRLSLWNFGILINGILSSVVFGFSFMELTLSLARRIKAYNIKSRLLIRELYHWLQRKSGDQRLKIYVWIYVVLEVLFVVYMYNKYQVTSPALMIFFAFMWIVALYAVGKFTADMRQLSEEIDRIREGDFDTEVKLQYSSSLFDDLAIGINHVGDGLKDAVEKSLKDERVKTELITNVSHDLKTPLTSIINYINLLKTEKMPTPEAEHYIEVLESKAHRLSHLTEDLVDAAKVTSGNVELNMMPLSFDELVKQALGEFEEKYEEKNLEAVITYPDRNESETYKVMADGRRLYRILENVLQNAYKYSLENTRIYIEMKNVGDHVKFVIKNVSKAPLNISAEELMLRFTRGDSSRATEGSGLGLSISKDLTKLMGGSFSIELDGDLFKVIIIFPRIA